MTASGNTASGITVTGTGTVTGVPDRLHFGVGVEARRPTAHEAYLQAADAAARVFDSLAGLDVPGLRRGTGQVGLRAEILWGEDQAQRVSGYVASQELTISIDDVASASAVLDAVVRAGGDDARINSLSFGFSDTAARMALAQEAAWEDARERAERWARLAGCTLGAVDELTEGFGAPPRPVFQRAMLAEEASMPVEPGAADVVCTVTVRWRIGPPA